MKYFMRCLFSICTGVSAGLVLLMVMTGSAGAVNFTANPIPLVDIAARSADQYSAQGEFDWNGNFHAIWVDTRNGNSQIFGTTLLPDSSIPLTNYKAHNSYIVDNLIFSRIHRSILDINSMFVLTLNSDLSTLFTLCPSTLDYTGLPSAPTSNDLTTATSLVDTPGVSSMVMAGTIMVYAMEYNGDIYLNTFDFNTQAWGGSETVLDSPGDYTYHHPQLCTDAADYIYIIYDRYDTLYGEYSIVAQRSQQPSSVSGFEVEHDGIISAPYPTDGFHDPDIAACGASSTSDLQVAVAYIDPNPAVSTIYYDYEFDGDWTMSAWLGTTPFELNPDVTGPVTIFGPELMYDADNTKLYATWADDRNGPMDLHFCTMENPYAVGEDIQLTTGAEITDRPYVTAGPTMNEVAVVYSALDGGNPSTFAMMFRPDFFDDCSIPPENTGYYSAVNGVTLSNEQYLSEYTSYKFENASAKSSSLLVDYGTLEHTGSINLYFYDDETITANGDDFYITLDNANQKGVIRMLGVKNDVSTSNYFYYDGINWFVSGLQRHTGWHHIVITVSAGGIEMEMEEYPLSGLLSPVYSDSTFTSFTSIAMEGGNPGSPYYVDDILLETNPAISEPPPIPSTSLIFLMIALAVMGIWLVRRTQVKPVAVFDLL